MEWIAYYDAYVAQEGWEQDPSQRAVALSMQEVCEGFETFLVQNPAGGKWYLPQSWKHPSPPSGFYLYGDVGRGKTRLARLWVDYWESLAMPRAGWLHFHQLISRIHGSHAAEDRTTALGPLARMGHGMVSPLIARLATEMVREHRWWCLDELHVMDVADVALITQWLMAMREAGAWIFVTSNRAPGALFLDRPHWETAARLVAHFQAHYRIFSIDGSQDYRRLVRPPLDISSYDTGPEPLAFVDSWLARLGCHRSDGRATTLELPDLQRGIAVPWAHREVVMAPFDVWFSQPLGVLDYQAIVQHWSVIILTDIPKLGPEYRNEAKRLMILVDALYQRHRLLIITAAATPDQLYTEGHGSFEFARTVSRLMEMQSAPYLAEAMPKPKT